MTAGEKRKRFCNDGDQSHGRYAKNKSVSSRDKDASKSSEWKGDLTPQIASMYASYRALANCEDGKDPRAHYEQMLEAAKGADKTSFDVSI